MAEVTAGFSKEKLIEFIHKYFMFATIAVVFLAGIASLGVGIWMKVDGDFMHDSIKGIAGKPHPRFNFLLNLSYLLLLLGVALLIIGFLGCVGVIKECSRTVLVFTGMVSMMFVAKVVGILILGVYTPPEHQMDFDMLGDLREVVKTKLAEYKVFDESKGDHPDLAFTKAWNDVMEEYECCGFDDYKDFNGSKFYHDFRHDDSEEEMFTEYCCYEPISSFNSRSGIMNVPTCPLDKCEIDRHIMDGEYINECDEHEEGEDHEEGCTEVNNNVSSNYPRLDISGCSSQIQKRIHNNFGDIQIVAICITALELCAMVFSMTIYLKIRAKRKELD